MRRTNRTKIAALPEPTTPTQPLVLTVKQVAGLLQISPSAIYEKTRWRAGQKNPLPCRRVGKFLRFIRSEVEVWLLNLPVDSKRAKRRYNRKAA